MGVPQYLGQKLFASGTGYLGGNDDPFKLGFKGTLNIELPRSNDDRALSKRRLEPILAELGILEQALKP